MLLLFESVLLFETVLLFKYLRFPLTVLLFEGVPLFEDIRYTSEQLMQIKKLMTKIDTHLASLTDTITEQHDQLVTNTKATESLFDFG